MAMYNSSGESLWRERTPSQPWQPPEVAPQAPAAAPEAAPAAAPETSLWDEIMAQEEPSGGGGDGGGGGFDPYSAIQAAPEFSYQAFKAPTAEDMQADPSYNFRLNTGRQALERSQAAKGLLRTGGSLKDLMDYGQNLASQEYGNVYNRALQTHQLGLQQAKMAYDPRFAQWQMASQLVAPRYGGGGGGGEEDIAPPPEFWDPGEDYGDGGGGGGDYYQGKNLDPYADETPYY